METAELGDVWRLEQDGWQAIIAGTAREFYDRVLTDNAVMVVPGMVLDRDQVLASWDGVVPWQTYSLSDERVVSASPDATFVTYRATATRAGEKPYRALMSSVYVRSAGQWRLALHQQTPLP